MGRCVASTLWLLFVLGYPASALGQEPSPPAPTQEVPEPEPARPAPTQEPVPDAPGPAPVLRPVVVEAPAPVSSSSEILIPHKDFELRPTGRPADILRIIPGVVIGQHHGGARPSSIFCAGSTTTTAPTSPSSPMVCPSTCGATRMARGTRTCTSSSRRRSRASTSSRDRITANWETSTWPGPSTSSRSTPSTRI
jgi:hypothetical protein